MFTLDMIKETTKTKTKKKKTNMISKQNVKVHKCENRIALVTQLSDMGEVLFILHINSSRDGT
jgi:hypothetical protein